MKEVYEHKAVDVGAKNPFVVTKCNLVGIEDKIVATGISICSFKDHYNRKLGNRIAKGRAVTAAIEEKTSRPVQKCLQQIAGSAFKCIYCDK